jgi:hypothetical protein
MNSTPREFLNDTEWLMIGFGTMKAPQRWEEFFEASA